MNLLVYLGLCNYDLLQARADLMEKSRACYSKSGTNTATATRTTTPIPAAGCDVRSSDAFYHWGGLSGLIASIQAEMGKK